MKTAILIISGVILPLSVWLAIVGSPAQPVAPVQQSQIPLTDCTKVPCIPIFPPDNPWNTDISAFPIHANSANFIASIGSNTGLHPDFGTVWAGAPNGIPFCIANPATTPVDIHFTLYGDQSDPGPYPVPVGAPIEGGPDSTGDRHVLVIDPLRRRLYELYYAFPNEDGSWDAGSGAVWDLTSNDLRPEGWTSADAAGLPIFPGLVRYDEAVIKGEIRHALRFTVQNTQKAYILPATHWASSSTNPDRPPMGLRLRLKASFNINTYPASVRPILQALKAYGMMVADNGSNWYISGAPDPRWDDDELATLHSVKGSNFEVVDTGPIITP
ncbi:MAG: hypothetical protein IT435_20530 [Phycisphaerales bacterium]|nr:hypothetical protein [Phycisphaerales bacterium]